MKVVRVVTWYIYSAYMFSHITHTHTYMYGSAGLRPI